MPLPVEEKQQIIKDFARKEGDSGSPEVQIALLTASSRLRRTFARTRVMSTTDAGSS